MMKDGLFGRSRTSTLLALLAVLVVCPVVQATTAAVDCNAKKDNSINAALALLTKQGPHTINISGACTEAVVIENFDDVTLAGTPGASITFPGGPDDYYVIFVSHSRNVTVRDITINGGFDSILCGFFSHCVFYNITVQGGQSGITFARSTGVVGDNSVLQNNLTGVVAIRNSHVRVGAWPASGGALIQNNGNATDGGEGIYIDDESYVDVFNSTVQDNDFGDGITVNFDSFLGLFNSTINSNGGAGVRAGASSFVRLRGSGTNTITGNVDSGIVLGHLTFLRINGARTISGNGAPDVACNASTAKTAGTGGSATPNLGGGTTNCTEPAP